MAADLNPHTNGPEGGRYMYDNMHYTPEVIGAASILKAILTFALVSRH